MKIFVFLIYLRGFLQFNVIRVIHYDNLIDSVCFQVTFELYQVSDNTVLHNGDAVFEYSTKQIISSLEKSTMAR